VEAGPAAPLASVTAGTGGMTAVGMMIATGPTHGAGSAAQSGRWGSWVRKGGESDEVSLDPLTKQGAQPRGEGGVAGYGEGVGV